MIYMNNDHLTYRRRIIQSWDQIFSVSEVSMVRCPVYFIKRLIYSQWTLNVMLCDKNSAVHNWRHENSTPRQDSDKHWQHHREPKRWSVLVLYIFQFIYFSVFILPFNWIITLNYTNMSYNNNTPIVEHIITTYKLICICMFFSLFI
jgi:hypothetical protein